MIELFHTSLQMIPEPDTKHSRSNLDFGRGFYLTSIKDHTMQYAERFAGRQKTRNMIYRIILNIYIYIMYA